MRDRTRTRAAGVVVALIAGALCVGCSAGDPNVSLEIRIVEDTPADHLTEMSMKVWNGQATFYARPEVLLTEKDVTVATVIRQDGAPAMKLVLSREAQERLYHITRHNVGSRLGVIINGQLQCAQPIEAPVDDGMVMVTGYMLERAAKRCSRALTRETA